MKTFIEWMKAVIADDEIPEMTHEEYLRLGGQVGSL